MDDIKKINSAIATIRQERLKYVETTLMTRQQENDKIGKLAGTAPARAELTISDFQNIENTFNKPLAVLKERARLTEGEAAAASVNALESQLEKAKAAQAEAARVLNERESQVKAIEVQIDKALRVSEAAGERRNKIKFDSRIPRLMDSRTSRVVQEDCKKSILNY